MSSSLWISCFALVFAAAVAAAELEPVPLPAPQKEGGMPLMQALEKRATARDFSPTPLPVQTLSNLLWAACGINRPDVGKRTAPSARNWQEIDVYVFMEKGVYVYDAVSHQMRPVLAGDHRAKTGTQDFVDDAPVTLILVADVVRMKGAQKEQIEAYAWADAAYISQNVYLFCASEGLATGVRASVDRKALAKTLGFTTDKRITFAQSVGFPKK